MNTPQKVDVKQHKLNMLRNFATLPDGQAASLIESFSKEQVKEAFAEDLFLQNYYLNMWEYKTRQVVLESYPWNVTLPIADLCNARCTFCTSWLEGKKTLKVEQLEFFRPVLKYARFIGLQGHGEPLVNPQISNILDVLQKELDPRCETYMITNGVFLLKHLDKLLDAGVTGYNFSLNATTPETHDKVMGLGLDALPKVIEGVKAVVKAREARKGQGKKITVTISMVLTQDNIHEAADFIRLGEELDVSWIYIRSLMPLSGPIAGLNYHLLPPYLHPDYDKHERNLLEAMAKTRIVIDANPKAWRSPVLTGDFPKVIAEGNLKTYKREDALKLRPTSEEAEKSPLHYASTGTGELIPLPPEDSESYTLHSNLAAGPYNRKAPLACGFVYHNLNINELALRHVPCCYMTQVPGHKPIVMSEPFDLEKHWNNAAMQALRSTLARGPLMKPCLTCPVQGVKY